MKLTDFKMAEKAFKVTVISCIGCSLIFGMCFIISMVYMYQKAENAYRHALVIDTSGKTYDTTPVLASDMRRFEYEDHVKRFVQLWYSFDESNYEKHLNEALNLIGNKGKELLNEYKDVNMLNSLIQKNIRYEVNIQDISIDMGTLPVSGEIIFTQTGLRSRGELSREIHARFTLYDVSRSRGNSHGAKIEQWEVNYYNPSKKENDL